MKETIPSKPVTVVWNNDSLTLDNGAVKRIIHFFADGEVSSVSYRLVTNPSEIEFLASRSLEFSIVVNDELYTGLSGWKVTGIEKTADATGGLGASIRLQPLKSNSAFEVKLVYLLYPNLPAIRKQLTVVNTGGEPLKVEEVDIENLCLNNDPTDLWIYRQYARYKHLGTYIGDCNDPLIIIHSQEYRREVAIGNETVGVIKRTACFEDGKSISAGFTHRNQEFPFRKWVEKGQQFTTPFVFTVLYEGHDDPSWVLNVTVPNLVRRHLGIRVYNLKKKPVFIYNTWYPFYNHVNDSLIYDLSKAAAACGIEEFTIDDGWQTNLNSTSEEDHLVYGDWAVDKRKFPDGLRPVFDSVKALKMGPGLWMSVAAAQQGSQPLTEHPEWFVRDEKGRITNLHAEIDYSKKVKANQPYTACMGTDWKDYIKKKILFYVKEYDLAYIKLDFSVVCSAYQFNKERTGCHAANHPYHKDREESYYVIYQRVMELFDELHAEAPSLFIDCTFETAGRLQLMDYGIAEHAQGNWLSNVQQSTPLGPLRVRDLAWGRCPALPAASLIIGNLSLDHPFRLLCFQSLAGALPIMLGDPRQLKPEERKEMKDWSDWLRGVEQRHEYSDYRQDLPGYGEPTEGAWDGFARVNTETKSGGLVGLFRQGAAEESRIITLPYLDTSALYAVKEAPFGKEVVKMTGAELEKKGFKVILKAHYQGMLYEIIKL